MGGEKYEWRDCSVGFTVTGDLPDYVPMKRRGIAAWLERAGFLKPKMVASEAKRLRDWSKALHLEAFTLHPTSSSSRSKPET